MNTALILAGGDSKRFGRPKALIDFAGRTLIEHVAAALRSVASELIVSVAAEEMGHRIRTKIPNAMFVRDQRLRSGPIEGIRQGFRMAQGEIVLVAPCDAPLLRPQLYSLLLDVLGDHDAAVPQLDVLDPVRAVYRRRKVIEVLDSDSEVPSPSALVDRLRAVHVAVDKIRSVDPSMASFVDVNTSEDLRRALEKVQSFTRAGIEDAG